MIIRPIKTNEIPLLTDFIYEAIFQKDNAPPVSRTIIQQPDIWVYVDSFGTKNDDHCLVAIVDKAIVAAVWVRCIDGFGNIGSTVPEFAISVYPQYRKMGIGTALMKGMLEYLKGKGYCKASLAVQKENYAFKMYRAVGFSIIKETDEEYIMACDL